MTSVVSRRRSRPPVWPLPWKRLVTAFGNLGEGLVRLTPEPKAHLLGIRPREKENSAPAAEKNSGSAPKEAARQENDRDGP